MKFLISILILFVLLLVSSDKVEAQVISDTVALSELIINGARSIEYTAGVKMETIDSVKMALYGASNLSDLLGKETNLFFKSYGLGSLATSSFRGASASQTAVLWNGFSISSPMNGVLDYALVPVSFVDQVKVQFGGCGALWGSGSVSGTIHLENKLRYNQGIEVKAGAQFGSFNQYIPSISITESRKNRIFSVKAFYSVAENNFPFKNNAIYGAPEMRQANAKVNLYGVMVDQYFKITKNNQLTIRLWHQRSNRQIPPTMVSANTKAFQEDWFVRLSSEWEHKRVKSTWNARIAYFNENLYYEQASAFIFSNNKSKSIISEVEGKWHLFKNGLLNIGLNNTYNEAKVDSYNGLPHQNRIALFSSYKLSNKTRTIQSNIGARKEWIMGSQYAKVLEVPVMPYIGVDLKLNRQVMLKSSVNRNYRLPTFNDLFWTPGGNVNLKPEQGWSEEIGVYFEQKKKGCTGEDCKEVKYSFLKIEYSSTVFNRVIDNWIMWVPETNYWVPENLLKVWSRGLENTVSSKWKLHQLYLSIGGGYDYVLSTNTKVPLGNENELDKQLIYVPVHKGRIYTSLYYKKVELAYTHQYTGWAYTQADNEAFVDAYWIGNVSVSNRFKIKNNQLNVFFRINNIWNTSYQVITYRAMPGRNFEIGMNVQLKIRNNEK